MNFGNQAPIFYLKSHICDMFFWNQSKNGLYTFVQLNTSLWSKSDICNRQFLNHLYSVYFVQIMNHLISYTTWKIVSFSSKHNPILPWFSNTIIIQEYFQGVLMIKKSLFQYWPFTPLLTFHPTLFQADIRRTWHMYRHWHCCWNIVTDRLFKLDQKYIETIFIYSIVIRNNIQLSSSLWIKLPFIVKPSFK